MVTQIDVDECCSYVARGEYERYEDIPDRYLLDDNYEIEQLGED